MSAAPDITSSLRFEPEGHRYFLGSQQLPSVTQVLSMLDKFEGVPLDVLEAARQFGSHVHMACDLDNKGVLDEDALDPALRAYLECWRRFRAESGFVLLSSEERLVHPQLRVAGTLDDSGLMSNELSIIDIKSGMVPRTVGYQTAAYLEMYALKHGKRPRRRYCVQLNPEFALGYKLHRLSKTTDYHMFVSCLNVWHDINSN
jgi:hypothetical protein